MSPPGDDDPHQPSDGAPESLDNDETTDPSDNDETTDPSDNDETTDPSDRDDAVAPLGDGSATSGSGTIRDNSGPGPDDRDRAPPRAGREQGTEPTEEDDGVDWVVLLTDVASSVVAVTLVGLFLFAVSGVWPPMVAVESASMHPNMQTGDLVFVMDADRFPGEGAHGDSGVVTAHRSAQTEYRQFERPGDVIVFAPDGNGDRTPIIHRAMFWVEDGENWYDGADPDARGSADGCEELTNCPAPHAGFVTLGDNNPTYDQVTGLSEPVRPGWVVGTAEARIPGLGWIRLRSSARGAPSDYTVANASAVGSVGSAAIANASLAGGGTAN